MEVVFNRLEKLKIIEQQELDSIREKRRLKRKKKNKPEWEWQPVSNGKGHYWFLKPKYQPFSKRK